MFIKIKVLAGAKHETIKKTSIDHYLISVKEPAERNLANQRICQLMAQELGVNKGLIRIISGHQSPSKIISVNI